MPEWTFLTNHALVLSFLAKHPRITARELAAAIGITERTTRKIIAALESARYITKKREGRGLRYRVNPDLSLRHPTHEDAAIGALLEALGWARRRRGGQAPRAKGQGREAEAAQLALPNEKVASPLSEGRGAG